MYTICLVTFKVLRSKCSNLYDNWLDLNNGKRRKKGTQKTGYHFYSIYTYWKLQNHAGVCEKFSQKFLLANQIKGRTSVEVCQKHAYTSYNMHKHRERETGRCPSPSCIIPDGRQESAHHLRLDSLSCKLADCSSNSVSIYIYVYAYIFVCESCIIHMGRPLNTQIQNTAYCTKFAILKCLNINALRAHIYIEEQIFGLTL